MKLLFILFGLFCAAAVAENGPKIVQAARVQIGVTTSYASASLSVQ